MKRVFLFLMTLIAACALRAQVSTENYVRSRTMLNEAESSYVDNIAYYDGLGRSYLQLQKHIKAGTTTGSDLCFVLQPMYQSNADLNLYAFQYKYDERNRCIYKKLSGVALCGSRFA